MMIVSNEKIFLDTNILYYLNDPSSEFGKQAQERINELYQFNNELVISTQTVKEYAHATLRNVVYHKFDLPSNIQVVIRNIQRFERDFTLINDNFDSYQSWLQLLPNLKTYKDVFDFNIVAMLRSNGINHILTHNEKDFKPFSKWLNVIPLIPKF